MILIPLLAAGAGAVCLGLAAHAQHEGVVSETAGRRLDLRAVRGLLRHPGWLTGAVLTMVGAALALFALSRAPLALVQPIGVLSVPIALLVACGVRHRPPVPAELTSVLATVLGVAGFVLCTAQHGPVPPPTATTLGRATLLLVPLVVAAAVVGRWGPSRGRALGWTVAAAVLYGLGTAGVKDVFLHGHRLGAAVLHHPAVWLLGAGALLAFVLGGWCVQHAYHAGSAHLVLAGLTVVDPLVAVLLGMTVLGEPAPSGIRLAGALLAAALAAVAIGYLAKCDGARGTATAVSSRVVSSPAVPSPAASSSAGGRITVSSGA